MARGVISLLFLWFLIRNQNTRAQLVSIGVIANPTSRIGREEKVAIQLAIEKFSPQVLLTSVLDLNTTDPSPVYSYVQNLIQLGADAIIARGTIPQMFVSGTVGEAAKIPVISMASSSPFLSGPVLIQMSYSEIAFVRCVADIVKSYNWRKVITIYEDDTFGSVSSSALLLSNALDAIGSELEYRVILPPVDSTSDPRSTVKEGLNHTKLGLSTVYIVLRISEALAPILFEEAVSLGMMSKGHIWICGNDITALLDSSFTPSFISKYMQGLVGIRSYINETALEYVNFRSNFQQKFKTEYEKNGENSFDPSVYAVRAYDAVGALFLAANTSKKNKKALVDNLIGSNFSDISGLMRPTNGRLDESERYSAFRIINVVGRSYREMGIWIDGSGFYENEDDYLLKQSSSEKLRSVVFWPGGPLAIPSGLRMLKVGIAATSATFNEFVSVKKTETSTSYSGFCIDVFNAILRCLGYEALYNITPYHIDVYDDLLQKVYLKEVDIVVGDVTITSDRSEYVSFTKPYLPSGLTMLVPTKANTKFPTNTFSLSIWLSMIILLLYYVLLVWFHEQVEGAVQDFYDSNWLKQFGASLWIVCKGIFSDLDDRIRSYHTKIVLIMWFVAAQLVLHFFTATLVSDLVTQTLKPNVNIMKIGCSGHSFVPNYLKSVLHIPDERIVKLYSASDYKTAFDNGTITAAYMEVPYLRVFVSKYEGYTMFNETKMLGGLGFVLPKGSLLTLAMSEAILKISENGTLRDLENKWFSASISDYDVPNDDSTEEFDLSKYTYVFVIGSALAFLTVLHRFLDAIYLNKGNQVAVPEQTLQMRQLEEQTPQESTMVIQQLNPRDVQIPQGGSGQNQRYRHSVSSSSMPTGTRVLLSFLSDRPQRAHELRNGFYLITHHIN